MLHFRTLEPKTLELLKEIQKITEFKDLRLVGGTGLSLQYGHRKSVDIDLFGKTSIDNDELALILKKIGKVEKLSLSKSINIFKINNIKVDIVNYPYRWLEKPLLSDNLKIDMGFRITLNRIAQENPSASAAELKQIFIKQAYGITIEKKS